MSYTLIFAYFNCFIQKWDAPERKRGREECLRLDHNLIGTEFILLGLIAEGTSASAKMLKSMGISLKNARIEVEKVIGRGSGSANDEPSHTPETEQLLKSSLGKAREFRRNYIDTGHLLLALIDGDECVGTQVLCNLGVDFAKIRADLRDILAA